MFKEVLSDPWFTVQQIDPRTYAISEYGHWQRVHSFLLLGQERAALIDTGLGIDNIKRVTDQLTDLPIQVLTTHVHFDHIGSHNQFEEIYVHPLDADWLENGIQGLPIQQVRQNIARDITLPTPVSFNPSTYFPYQGKPTGYLPDQITIHLGDRQLRIYHTPGHSPGHISILDVQNRYLFTGDTLYDETPIYAFYPSNNPGDLVDSLLKIASIPNLNKIFGSHNTLGLEPSIMPEVKRAAQELRSKGLDRHGTGLHSFNGFSLKF